MSPPRPQHSLTDCIVVGAGPSGLLAAMALAKHGLNVTVVGYGRRSEQRRDQHPPDSRTAALFPAAISMLRNLAVWPRLAAQCSPLEAIRIIDDTGFALRAPEVTFYASEIDLPAFGYNVPNDALIAALTATLHANGVDILDEGAVVGLRQGASNNAVSLASGRTLEAPLIVAADGRQSFCRTAVGLQVDQWDYGQVAIATRFAHRRPHRNISNELHRPAGPCTTVPLPGRTSSLVWVERPEEADRLMRMDERSFLNALACRLDGLLGDLGQLGVRRRFPLEGAVAKRMGLQRVALVGEAAHVLPPIGAQGLNLSAVDAAALADCVSAFRRNGQDIGSDQMLAAYDAARRGDVEKRMRAIDVLNQSLLAGSWPMRLLRGAGLHLIAGSSGLRRQLMREGLWPSGALPSLMRDAESVSSTL